VTIGNLQKILAAPAKEIKKPVEKKQKVKKISAKENIWLPRKKP